MADFYSNYGKVQNRNSPLSQFTCKEKKRNAHQPVDFPEQDSFSTTRNASVVMSSEENYADKMGGCSRKSNQKTLTWRSALVFSPNEKFSPQNISPRFQVRNKETDLNQIYNHSKEFITTRNNKDLRLSFQNSPKNSIRSQNPLSKKTSSSIFLLSDKENVELDGRSSNNDKMKIDSRAVKKGEGQIDHHTKKLPNAMEYYSQLSRSNSLDDRNINIKKISNDDKNISQCEHIHQDPILISKKIRSTSNSPITSLEDKEYIRSRSNQKSGNETRRQLSYPINPNCNFDRQFSNRGNIGYCCSNGSFKEQNGEEYLNKSVHYTPSKSSKLLMSPRNDTCVLNSKSTHMYPHSRLLPKCCGRGCDTSTTCKSLPLLNSTMSPFSMNQLPTNQGRMPQVGFDQYNYPVGFYSQQRTNASCLQSTKQIFADSESNNQMQNSLMLNENPCCFRRLQSQENYTLDCNGNSVLYEEDEVDVGNSSQRRRAQKCHCHTGNERLPLNQFASHSSSQPFSPMSRQTPYKNVVSTESFPYEDDFNSFPIKICNCQKCIRQNTTNTYGINIFPSYPADYYSNQLSPYFQVPSATYNPHSLNKFCVPFHGNHDPEIIPPRWYCPSQFNDKEYVMQKFLCSLDQKPCME